MEWYHWALGASLTLLQLVVGQLLVRLWARIDLNTDNNQKLALDVAKNYLPRSEHDADRREIRDSLHDLRNLIIGKKTEGAL